MKLIIYLNNEKAQKTCIIMGERLDKSLLFYATNTIIIYKCSLIYIILYVLIALHFLVCSDIIILIMFKGSLKDAVAAAVGAH